MGFHLVSRILAFDERSARGVFLTPSAGPELSPCLVAEAIGQLAAWAAMARFDFAVRPVAGLAGDVEFFGNAPRGGAVDLAVTIDRLDATAIAYDGTASSEGRGLLEMRGCVGPMMPMAEFEDPERARARFGRLTGAGDVGLEAAPEPVPLVTTGGTPGKRRVVRFRVPTEAPYFADHFPAKPVFPGTLLLDAQQRVADELAREAVGPAAAPRLVARRAKGVKFRAFLAPGDEVEIEAAVASIDASGVRIRLGARRDGQRAGDSRIDLVLEPPG